MCFLVVCLYSSLTLLLPAPFASELTDHLKPFTVVVLNGVITVHTVISPMVLNGGAADTESYEGRFKWSIKDPTLS